MPKHLLSWIFATLFAILGVLNVIFVHVVPGSFYLLLAGLYLPPVQAAFEKRFDLVVPAWVQLLVAVVVIWGTLAVGDLAELAGL